MDTRKNIRLRIGGSVFPRHFANCQTMLVVYLLQCDCGCYYIGKSIQKIWKRIYRHILAMKTSNPDLPLGRHVTQVQNGHFPEVTVLVLDRIHPSHRGEDYPCDPRTPGLSCSADRYAPPTASVGSLSAV